MEKTEDKILSYDYMSNLYPSSEICNIALLSYTLSHLDQFPEMSPADLSMMRKIHRKADKVTGSYEPQYEQKGATLQGRVFCKMGLCALSRKWRNALAFKHYLDVDMDKVYLSPTVLEKIPSLHEG